MEMTEMLSDMVGMPPLQTVMEQGPVTPRPPASGCPPMSCEDKKALLHEIRVCTFALIEARLFLDSHPDDRQAIAFYRKQDVYKRQHLSRARKRNQTRFRK